METNILTILTSALGCLALAGVVLAWIKVLSRRIDPPAPPCYVRQTHTAVTTTPPWHRMYLVACDIRQVENLLKDFSTRKDRIVHSHEGCYHSDDTIFIPITNDKNILGHSPLYCNQKQIVFFLPGWDLDKPAWWRSRVKQLQRNVSRAERRREEHKPIIEPDM